MAADRSPKGRVQTGAAFCPRCGVALSVGCDMWGLYWFCEDCGFSAEDDEGLGRKAAPPGRAPETPPRKCGESTSN